MLYYRQGVGGGCKPSSVGDKLAVNDHQGGANSATCLQTCKRGSVGAVVKPPNIINVAKTRSSGSYYSPLVMSKGPLATPTAVSNQKQQSVDSADVESRSILVAGVTSLISLKRLLQAFQEYDSTGGGRIESFEFVGPEQLRITYLYKADADRVLAKSSIFIMDNFILTMSKFNAGRYYQAPTNNNVYSPYVHHMQAPPNLNLAPSYTAYQAHSHYRLAPVESKPASNYFVTNFTTSMTSPSALLIDKRRILLKNVPYSIDKEYLELYLEYLSDDNNEIERYDLLKHSKDSLVVTFLKDVDFAKVKRKHANRPKLLNNRISLSQVTLPSTVVLEHVDNYHVNLHSVPVESLVDRALVEAYFRRRLKDERLGLRVVFDRENNWILVKFRRHEIAKRVASSRVHEILKKKFKVKLFYDQLGPDPFSDPPYFFNKEKSFHTKPNAGEGVPLASSKSHDSKQAVKEAKIQSPKSNSNPKDGKIESDSGVETDKPKVVNESAEPAQTNLILGQGKPVVLYEKLTVSGKAPTDGDNEAETRAKTEGDVALEKEFYAKFSLNKKPEFFNTDIQSIYDEYDVTASLDSFLNEVDCSQPGDCSFNPRNSVHFKSSAMDTSKLVVMSTPKLAMATTEIIAETSINTNGSTAEHWSKNAKSAAVVNRGKVKSVITVMEERVKDLTELNLAVKKPKSAGSTEQQSGKPSKKQPKGAGAPQAFLDCSFTATSSSDDDETQVIRADIEKYDLDLKASDLKKLQPREPSKPIEKRPVVNLPSLNDPPLSFEEYNMLNYFDKYDKIIKDSKNLTYYNNTNSHYNPNGVLHFHLSNSFLASNANDGDSGSGSYQDAGSASAESSADDGSSSQTGSSSFDSSDLSLFNTNSGSMRSGKPVKRADTRGARGSPREPRMDEEKSIFSRKNFPQEFNKNFLSSYASFAKVQEAKSPVHRHQNFLQKQPHLPSPPAQVVIKETKSRPLTAPESQAKPTKSAVANPFESSPFQKAFKNINYSSSRRQPRVISGDRHRPVAPKLVQLKIKQFENAGNHDGFRPASGPPPPKLVPRPNRSALGALRPRPVQPVNQKSPPISKPVIIKIVPAVNEPAAQAKKPAEFRSAVQNTFDSTEAVIGGVKVNKPPEQSKTSAEINNENHAVQLAINNGLSVKEKYELKSIKVNNSPYLLAKSEENKKPRLGGGPTTKIVTNQYGCVMISQSINRLTPFALEFFQKTKYLNQLSMVYPRLAISLKEKLKSVYLFGPHQLVKDIKAKIEYDLGLFKELEFPLESGDLAECLQKPTIKQKLLKFIEPILIRQQQQKHKEIISEFKKGNELKNDLNDHYIITATNNIVYFCSYYVKSVAAAESQTEKLAPPNHSSLSTPPSHKLVVCTNFLEIGDLLNKYIKSSFKVNQRLEVKSRKVFEAIDRNSSAWLNFANQYSSLVNINLSRFRTNDISLEQPSTFSTLLLNSGQLFITKLVIELTGIRVDVDNFVTDFNKTFENSS